MHRMHAVIGAFALLLAAPAAAEEYAQVPAVPETTAAPATPPPAEPAAAPAPAPALKSGYATDQGWNGQWGLLFQLNNIFTNANILDEFEGRIGGAYYLDRETALRVGVGLSRQTTPAVITKEVTESGPEKVEEYTIDDPQWTSVTSMGLAADYLKRLMPSAIAPYAGAGISLGWNRLIRDYKDEVTVVDQVETYDRRLSTMSVGLRGIIGAEWRVHSSFALFAEYSLDVSVFEHARDKDSYTVENTLPDGQVVARRDTEESASSRWLGAGTALTQGAQFGLSVQF